MKKFIYTATILIALNIFGCSDGPCSHCKSGDEWDAIQAAGKCSGFVEGTKREHYGIQKEQFCDERDGQKYVYVTIGTQTWMAENLNYNATNSVCYEDKATNCTTYGRLYSWATAMDLPVFCDGNSCTNQVISNQRGICPNGWHIPTNAEWDKLYRTVDGTSGITSPYESPTAGRNLKAASDWDNNGKGTDDYGFSALPSGGTYDTYYYRYIGSIGHWWTANEYEYENYAYERNIKASYIQAYYGNFNKNSKSSIRCVKDI